MKQLLFFFTPILLLSSELIINVNNIKITKGSLYIGVYKDKKHFTKITEVYKSNIIPISNKNSLTTVFNLPPNIYAISIFHDQNNNTQLDTNFLGIPKEGFGFSNNPKIIFSKPSFKECAFELSENKTITINMEY